ncbi:MAG: hypothetical protein DWP95_10340 [Proteobacteria bacterium]|nr:MAG: hypothetical protein DWP95_10340 [Pseudomonadota bacterium]
MIKLFLKYAGFILFVSGILISIHIFYLITINNQLNIYNAYFVFYAEKSFISVLLQVVGVFMMINGFDEGDL